MTIEENLFPVLPVRFVDTENVEMDIIYETDGFSKLNRWKAKVAKKFFTIFDDLESCQSGCVPAEVAIVSKNRPAIAMYLFVFDEWNILEIAVKMDLDIETIRRYKTRVLDESFDGT